MGVRHLDPLDGYAVGHNQDPIFGQVNSPPILSILVGIGMFTGTGL